MASVTALTCGTMTPRKELTESQRQALVVFANTQHAYAAVKATRVVQLEEMRLAALAGCLELGVPIAWLASESGLHHSSIHQLIRKLGGGPKLRKRYVPEETP